MRRNWRNDLMWVVFVAVMVFLLWNATQSTSEYSKPHGEACVIDSSERGETSCN